MGLFRWYFYNRCPKISYTRVSDKMTYESCRPRSDCSWRSRSVWVAERLAPPTLDHEIPGFEFHWRRNLAHDCTVLYWRKPSIVILPMSQDDLNKESKTPNCHYPEGAVWQFLYPQHTKYAKELYSFHLFRPSVRLFILPSFHPSVISSVNTCYNQVLLRSFFDYIYLCSHLSKTIHIWIGDTWEGSLPLYIFGPLDHAQGQG